MRTETPQWTQKLLVWNNSQAKLRIDGGGEAVRQVIWRGRELQCCYSVGVKEYLEGGYTKGRDRCYTKGEG